MLPNLFGAEFGEDDGSRCPERVRRIDRPLNRLPRQHRSRTSNTPSKSEPERLFSSGFAIDRTPGRSRACPSFYPPFRKSKGPP